MIDVQLALAALELGVIVLDLVGAELEQIAQLVDLLLAQLRDLARRPCAGRCRCRRRARPRGSCAEQLGRRRRERLVDAAADEEEAGELAVEHDGAGDDVEAEVALVDDAATAGARRRAAQLVARDLDRLVAAAEALLREERQPAEVVVGRDDLALGVIEDVALGVGEGQLHPPPLADDLFQHLDGVELFVWPKIDHRISVASPAPLCRSLAHAVRRTKRCRNRGQLWHAGAMRRALLVAVLLGGCHFGVRRSRCRRHRRRARTPGVGDNGDGGDVDLGPEAPGDMAGFLPSHVPPGTLSDRGRRSAARDHRDRYLGADASTARRRRRAWCSCRCRTRRVGGARHRRLDGRSEREGDRHARAHRRSRRARSTWRRSSTGRPTI